MLLEDVVMVPFKIFIGSALLVYVICTSSTYMMKSLAISRCRGDLSSSYKSVVYAGESKGQGEMINAINRAIDTFPGFETNLITISDIKYKFNTNEDKIKYIGKPSEIILYRTVTVRYPFTPESTGKKTYTITQGGGISDRTGFNPSKRNGSEYKLGPEFYNQSTYQ